MTALISVIPILLLIVLMMGFKVSGYKSAVVTLIVTILLALFAVPAMGPFLHIAPSTTVSPFSSHTERRTLTPFEPGLLLLGGVFFVIAY